MTFRTLSDIIVNMDKQKATKLEELVNDTISKFTTSTGQTKDGVLSHFEITIKFRKDEELDAAIEQLAK